MQKIIDIFTTRELAFLIWLTIFCISIIFVEFTRKSFPSIIKSFFVKSIISIITLLTIYVFVSVVLLKLLTLWDTSLVKDTIFWFFGFAIVTLFNIPKAKEKGFFKSIILDSFKWTIFIEFLINFYTFSLTTELILLPLLLFITMTQTYSKSDPENENVTRFLTNIMTLIGLGILMYVLYKTITDYKIVFTKNNFYTFLLPLFLTILILPFFYFVALYMRYEELFVHADFLSNDKEKCRKLKLEILKTAKLNLEKVTTINVNINKFDFYHSTDIKEYIKSIK